MKWKICLFCTILCLLFFGSGMIVCAESMETMPDGYTKIEHDLPEDVAELLPENLFSSDPQEAMTAAETLSKPEYLLRVIMEAIGLRLPEALRLLGCLLGLLLLSALLHRLRAAWESTGGEGVTFCLRLCMYAAIMSGAVTMITTVKAHFERMTTLMTAMAPVMGVLYALGGNLAQAASNEGIFLISMNICDFTVASVTPAVCGVCMAFALLEAFGGMAKTQFTAIGGLIKKWYLSLLGFVMFLLSVALSVQSVLSVGADNMSMRGIKYAVGQMIPAVGGAVSGTLGSVAAGVEMIRGVTGVSGIILVGLLLLPTLVQLLLFRMCYQMTATIATLLGCDGEAGLLGEMGSLYGYMAAAVSICSVVFVLALAIFAHSTTAVA